MHAGNGHSPILMEESYQLEQRRWSRGRNVLAFIALVAWVACAVGFAVDRTQFFRSYLVAFGFGITIALGAFFFVMVQYLTGSAWSVTLRRLMENIMVTLPVGALLFIPVALGLHELYEWTDAAVVAKDAILGGKAGYLNENFFLIRTAGYFLLWSIWSLAIYRQSTKQDTERSVRQMRAASRWSAPGLLLVVVAGTLASFDWFMSLDPRWYSTIFGLYLLSGGAVAFMAVLTLICLGFRSAGVLKNSIHIEHYHDLGKWMFALTSFYTYIAFSQYLLIWYASIPEETIWYRHRFVGNWLWVSVALLVGRFFVPFFVLLSRPAKRNLNVLRFAALWILAMHFVDMYWVTMPTWFQQGVSLHWLDVATLLAVTSAMGLVFWSRLKRHSMVAVGDLRFEQGLRFENA